jgi:tousled-like kinase
MRCMGFEPWQVLPEKEARVITSQIVAGLAYLAAPPRRIIHYDLKPANCLFDGLGQVKITVSIPLFRK